MSKKFEDMLNVSESKYLGKHQQPDDTPGNKTNKLLEAGSLFGDESEKDDKRGFVKRAMSKISDTADSITHAREMQKHGGTFGAVADTWAKQQPKAQEQDDPNSLFSNNSPAAGNQPPVQSQTQTPKQKQPQAQTVKITAEMMEEWQRMNPQLRAAYGDNIDTWAKIKTLEQQFNQPQS